MPAPRDADRTPVEQLKTDHAGVIRTLHRSLRRYPGGATDIARMLNQDPTLFLDKFNPSNFDHAPNLWLFLATLEYVQCRETAHAVASLANCTTVLQPTSAPGLTFGAAVSQLETKLAESSVMLEHMQTHKDSGTRAAMRRQLLDLIQSAHALAQKLHGSSTDDAHSRLLLPAPLSRERSTAHVQSFSPSSCTEFGHSAGLGAPMGGDAQG